MITFAAPPGADPVIGLHAVKPRQSRGNASRSAAVIGAVLLLMGLGGRSAADPTRTDTVTHDRHTSPFDVSFNDCSELASITTISVARARTVVPASFALGGDATGVPFVVRVAHCRAVSIDGAAPRAGTVAQLGVSVVSPDGTGDINNYTAF